MLVHGAWPSRTHGKSRSLNIVGIRTLADKQGGVWIASVILTRASCSSAGQIPQTCNASVPDSWQGPGSGAA